MAVTSAIASVSASSWVNRTLRNATYRPTGCSSMRSRVAYPRLPSELGNAANRSACSPSGSGGDDLAGAGEHVQLQDRLVRQAVAERGRLDPEAGHRAAQRDGAQLRHHQRHQAVRQRRVDQVLVGAHALHVGGTAGRVDRRARRSGHSRRAPESGERTGDGTGWRCVWPAGQARPWAPRRTTAAACPPLDHGQSVDPHAQRACDHLTLAVWKPWDVGGGSFPSGGRPGGYRGGHAIASDHRPGRRPTAVSAGQPRCGGQPRGGRRRPGRGRPRRGQDDRGPPW